MNLRRSFGLMLCLAAASGSSSACSNEDDGSDLETKAIADTKTYVAGQLEALVQASKAIQAAAPAPDDDGWNADDDDAAVAKMRDAWNEARDAYERVEGSIAILFTELDVSTDERYDGFIEEDADDDLFDDEGVTGMHAIERILWAGEHPSAVVEFEKALPSYTEAAFPKNREEADGFKNKLAKKLVSDVEEMEADFQPRALDAPTAFWGVIGSMNEQLEKVTLATTASDESRYARRTLDDMRANLDGGLAVYAAFRDWVRADAGDEVDADIRAGFDKLKKAYAEIDGPAIPRPPVDFNPMKPTDEQLGTPFGKLYGLLLEETDIEEEGSLIHLMDEAAEAMSLDEVE